MGWFVWVGLWVELISHKTRDATPYSYVTAILESTSVYFNLNIIVFVQLCVAGEGPTIEWSHLPRKIVREKRQSFLGHGDLLVLEVTASLAN